MTSSVNKRVVEVCCEWIRLDQHRECHYRYVELLRNEIFESLVEIYSRWIMMKMDKLEGLADAYVDEAGGEYEGKPHLYLARVYISAFFHDLYVSNRYACQKLCIGEFVERYDYAKDLAYMSLTYDHFLVHLLGSILPTEIKLVHERTLFIPRISPNIQFDDVNKNYFGISNWVYNLNLLLAFVGCCECNEIMDMRDIPKNESGRPFWLFDWHGDKCYSWFPVEPNCTMDDEAMAYIIGTACTSRLALRDYDEWQQFPGNVRPVEAHPNNYKRVRDLVYHGSVMVRTMEERSFVIPSFVLSSALARTCEEASSTEQDQEKSNFHIRKKQRLATTELSKQTCNYDTGIRTHDQQLVGSGHTGKEAEENPIVLLPNIEQFRLVDYLYDSIVIYNAHRSTRYYAFTEMLQNKPNQE